MQFNNVYLHKYSFVFIKCVLYYVSLNIYLCFILSQRRKRDYSEKNMYQLLYR
jgi:hypothetical protein